MAIEAEEEAGEVGSSLTLERVAAAKQFIESHYKAQMKHIQDRKQRYENHFLLFILFPRISLSPCPVLVSISSFPVLAIPAGVFVIFVIKFGFLFLGI